MASKTKAKECGICTSHHGLQASTIWHEAKKGTPICSYCALAESFVYTDKNACILKGGSPQECGVLWEEWKVLVLDTRQTTTDKIMNATLGA